MRGQARLRLVAGQNVRLLRLFLRRFVLARFGKRCCPLKVGVGHVHIVPHRHGLGITQPLRDHSQRELPGQVSFATRPHQMPQPGPGFQAGAANDFFQRGSQICIRPAAGALGTPSVFFGNDVPGPFGGMFDYPLHVSRRNISTPLRYVSRAMAHKLEWVGRYQSLSLGTGKEHAGMLQPLVDRRCPQVRGQHRLPKGFRLVGRHIPEWAVRAKESRQSVSHLPPRNKK